MHTREELIVIGITIMLLISFVGLFELATFLIHGHWAEW